MQIDIFVKTLTFEIGIESENWTLGDGSASAGLRRLALTVADFDDALSIKGLTGSFNVWIA